MVASHYGANASYFIKAMTVVIIALFPFCRQSKIGAGYRLLFLLFALYTFASVPYGLLLGASAFHAFGDFMGLLVLIASIMVAASLPSEEQRRLMGYCVAVSLVVFAVGSYSVRGGAIEAKLPAIHPVVIAYFVAMATVHTGRQRLHFYLATMVAFLVNAAGSDSRGGVLFAMITIILALFMAARKRSTVLLILLVPLFFYPAYEFIQSKYATIFTAGGVAVGGIEVDQSSAQRWLEIESIFSTLKSQPWMVYAVGLGSGAEYQDIYGLYGGGGVHHSHVTIGFMYLKYGLFGVWFFIATIPGLLARLIWLNINKRRSDIEIAARDPRLFTVWVASICLFAYFLQLFIGQEYLWNPVLGLIIGMGLRACSAGRRPEATGVRHLARDFGDFRS